MDCGLIWTKTLESRCTVADLLHRSCAASTFNTDKIRTASTGRTARTPKTHEAPRINVNVCVFPKKLWRNLRVNKDAEKISSNNPIAITYMRYLRIAVRSDLVLPHMRYCSAASDHHISSMLQASGGKYLLRIRLWAVLLVPSFCVCNDCETWHVIFFMGLCCTYLVCQHSVCAWWLLGYFLLQTISVRYITTYLPPHSSHRIKYNAHMTP